MKKTYRLGLFLGLASWLAVGLLLALLAVIRTGQQLDSDAQRVADGLTGQLYRQQSDDPAAAQSLLQRWDLAWLEVRDTQKNTWLAGGQGVAAPAWFKGLYAAATQPQHLTTSHALFNYQLNFAPQRQALLQDLGMIAALWLLGSLLLLLSHRQVLGRLSQQLQRQLAQLLDQNEVVEGPLPSVTDGLHQYQQQWQQRLDELQRATENLARQASSDPLTSLYNRECFRRDLTEILQTEDQGQSHYLVMVRASSLQTVNELRGHAVGDKYLQDVANQLSRSLRPLADSQAYRLSGSDFAMLIRKNSSQLPNLLGRELKQAFDGKQLEYELESVAFTGITLFRPGQSPEEVIARADLALARAQTGESNGSYYQEGSDVEFLQGESHWKRVIMEVIEHKSLVLMRQPIQSLSIANHNYHEIFARFIGREQQSLPTETLLAMAQRHDLLVKVEQLIIETIVQKYPSYASPGQRWGINLSSSALTSNAFLVWLERLLLRDVTLAASFVFEVEEDLLDRNLAASRRLFELMRRAGSRSSISKFGKGLASFRLYRELKPDFVKLDPSLLQNLEQESTNQQFIRMIVELSHRMGCVVVAEGVEKLSEKQLLENMYVDAIQGYLVAKPAPLTDPVTAPHLDVLGASGGR
ncbi:EAL domain-containing protein [Pseudaeromonas sp. ZJS20]|uniref:EAL domain-containing protein n=1 Tax=Pseudaeromonas aegiceratis TaxID=3153928 RepID=UPI00390C5035